MASDDLSNITGVSSLADAAARVAAGTRGPQERVKEAVRKMAEKLKAERARAAVLASDLQESQMSEWGPQAKNLRAAAWIFLALSLFRPPSLPPPTSCRRSLPTFSLCLFWHPPRISQGLPFPFLPQNHLLPLPLPSSDPHCCSLCTHPARSAAAKLLNPPSALLPAKAIKALRKELSDSQESVGALADQLAATAEEARKDRASAERAAAEAARARREALAEMAAAGERAAHQAREETSAREQHVASLQVCPSRLVQGERSRGACEPWL